MTTELATSGHVPSDLQEKVLLGGDLNKLTPTERLSFYNSVCTSLALNPLTRPFEYIVLNGKLTLYARKDCTEQLRNKRHISINILSRELVDGVFVVTAQATDAAGRTDESIGAVPIGNLQGEAKANAMMKAETKAKRRVTLSICGLGMLDESEIDSIPGARTVVEKDTRSLREKVQAKIVESTPVVDTPPPPVDTPALPADPTPASAETDAAATPAFIWRCGKHKSESIRTIPAHYLAWFAREGKLEDHREEARLELDRRNAQAAMTMDARE